MLKMSQWFVVASKFFITYYHIDNRLQQLFATSHLLFTIAYIAGHYCSKEHQRTDWKDHKLTCDPEATSPSPEAPSSSPEATSPSPDEYLTKSSLLFKELDIIIDREPPVKRQTQVPEIQLEEAQKQCEG